MKILKNIIFIIVICITSYLLVKISNGTDGITLYNGIPFDSRIYFYIVQFFLFSCYSFYIYNEFETLFYQYGYLLMVREHSRKKTIGRLVKKLLLSILFLTLIRTISYFTCLFVIKKRLDFNEPLYFIYMLLIDFTVIFLVLLIQMAMEILLSGKTALYICLAYYLICMGISDMFYESDLQMLNLLLLPNLSMKSRLNQLLDYNSPYSFIIIFLVTATLVSYFFFRRIFLKKDILNTD